MQTRLTYLSFMVNKKMCVSFFVQCIFLAIAWQNGHQHAIICITYFLFLCVIVFVSVHWLNL